jgi:hypothetical protein
MAGCWTPLHVCPSSDRELACLRDRGLHVIGVNKVEIGLREEFVCCETGRSFPGRVDPLEIAVVAGDAQHVERQQEEAVQFLECQALVRSISGHMRSSRDMIGRV